MKTRDFFLTAGMLIVAAFSGLGQPVITVPPANQTASVFADATFHVSATGVAPLSYQWRFNNADLSGMTNATLPITDVQRTNAGTYSVVVTDATGSITNQGASLTITSFNSLYFFGFSWTGTSGLAPDG